MSKKQTSNNVSTFPCPHCGANLKMPPTTELADLQETSLRCRCPTCKEPLTRDVFDSIAIQKLKERHKYEEAENTAKDTAVRHEAIAELIKSRLLKPLAYLLKKNSNKQLKQANSARHSKDALTVELDALARGAYYTSTWYRHTTCPLKTSAAFPGPYELAAKYRTHNKKAELYLQGVTGGQYASGFIGEWTVFEALQRYILKNLAPNGVRLIPNVYIPAANEAAEGLADETDLLILSRKAAIVCEVKNWRSHICVKHTQDGVAIKTYKNAELNEPDKKPGDKPLQQISQRMADLALLGLYPQNRIYGAVVFVNPTSFTTDKEGFYNKLCITTCTAHKSTSLFTLLTNEIEPAEDALSQEEVDAFANTILKSWVDRDGELTKRQGILRSQAQTTAQNNQLITLADLSINHKQEQHQHRVDVGKKREKAKTTKRNAKSKRAREERHAYKERLYEIEQEYDEWDYFAS